MKLTVADFLRDAQKPSFRIKCIERYRRLVTELDRNGGWRVVTKIMPQRGVMLYNPVTDYSSELLLYPASLTDYIVGSLTHQRRLIIYDKGLRDLLPSEDRYSLKKNESYDYNTGKVRTPKVKGDAILIYEVIV